MTIKEKLNFYIDMLMRDERYELDNIEYARETILIAKDIYWIGTEFHIDDYIYIGFNDKVYKRKIQYTSKDDHFYVWFNSQKYYSKDFMIFK